MVLGDKDLVRILVDKIQIR